MSGPAAFSEARQTACTFSRSTQVVTSACASPSGNRPEGTTSSELIRSRQRGWARSREHRGSVIPLSSPLTKSARSDSIWRREQTGVRLWQWEATAGWSGPPDGDVVRDAALAGPRVLRPLAVLVASGFDGFVEEA